MSFQWDYVHTAKDVVIVISCHCTLGLLVAMYSYNILIVTKYDYTFISLQQLYKTGYYLRLSHELSFKISTSNEF